MIEHEKRTAYRVEARTPVEWEPLGGWARVAIATSRNSIWTFGVTERPSNVMEMKGEGELRIYICVYTSAHFRLMYRGESGTNISKELYPLRPMQGCTRKGRTVTVKAFR